MSLSALKSRVAGLSLLSVLLVTPVFLNLSCTRKTPLPLVPLAPSTPTPGSCGTGKIVFTSWQVDNDDIWVMNPDGSSAINLTNSSPVSEGGPQWSPNGCKIVFVRGPVPIPELWVMNADGSGQVNLSVGQADASPDWSPDGTKIVFQRLVGGASQIWTMNPDGSGQTQLTSGTPDDNSPTWAADGSKIFFSRGPSQEIYSMNTDGSGVALLFGTPHTGNLIRESPLGGLYYLEYNGGMDRLDSAGNVLGTLPCAFHVGFSPDGLKIVFIQWDCLYGTNEIRVANLDGSGSVDISLTAYADRFPDWK